METALMFGLGFAAGLVLGMHICRIVWPEYEESIWERKSREKRIMNEAVEEYKKGIRDGSE